MKTREEILQAHLVKYYHHKGRLVNDDDILPVSRIKPMMDEYIQQERDKVKRLREAVKEIQSMDFAFDLFSPEFSDKMVQILKETE